MNKYDELSKLQKLKEDGTLNNEEFELEKQKILNNVKMNKMTPKNKKILIMCTSVLTILFMVITIIFTSLAVQQAMDTSTDLGVRLEIEKNRDMADYYKSKNDNYKYEQAMEKVKNAEEEWERKQNIESLTSWAPYVAGGVTIALLVVTIILKKKNKVDKKGV